MAQLLLLAGLGVIAFFLFKQAFGGGYGQADKRLPQPNLAKLTLKDARVNDVINITGGREDFEDLSFDVDRRNRYENGPSVWYELSGIASGKRVFLEVQDDDELVVTLDRGRKVFLDELGISEDDLERYAKSRSASNALTFEGVKFRFSFAGDVTYYKDARGEGEPYLSMEFTSEKRDQILYFEKWEEEPVECGLVDVLDPRFVSVLRK